MEKRGSIKSVDEEEYEEDEEDEEEEEEEVKEYIKELLYSNQDKIKPCMQNKSFTSYFTGSAVSAVLKMYSININQNPFDLSYEGDIYKIIYTKLKEEKGIIEKKNYNRWKRNCSSI